MFAPENCYVVLHEGKLLNDGYWDAEGQGVRMTVVGTDGGVGEEKISLASDAPQRDALRIEGHILSWKDPTLIRVKSLPGSAEAPGAR
ncbi:MAG: hypothetical protein EOP85_13240 [Verrucomicrobiaceae bacterium]|nr:MAG: hypothetical protein EOP85_13240 [Verrucomicrobiaceae bacterium]